MKTSYQKTSTSNILSLSDRPGIVRHNRRGLGYYTDNVVLFADGTIDPLPLDNGGYTYLVNERALICSMLRSLAGITEYVRALDWLVANGYSKKSINRLKGNAVQMERVIRINGTLYVPRDFNLPKGALNRPATQIRSDEETVAKLLRERRIIATDDVVDLLACDNEYARRLMKKAVRDLGGYYRGGKAVLLEQDVTVGEQLTPEKVNVIMNGGENEFDSE